MRLRMRYVVLILGPLRGGLLELAMGLYYQVLLPSLRLILVSGVHNGIIKFLKLNYLVYTTLFYEERMANYLKLEV
jgi:hypothetical protein